MIEGMEIYRGGVEVSEKPGEACGVFGIYAEGTATSQLAYIGLHALEHRGPAGAGISVSMPNGHEFYRQPFIGKAQGLGRVAEAFGEEASDLLGMDTRATIATGHTRYATVKDETLGKFEQKERSRDALQPVVLQTESGKYFSLSHNGHVEGLDTLADIYGLDITDRVSDSHGMAQLIAHVYEEKGDLHAALRELLPQFNGAYSLVMSTLDQLIVARDPHGFRPLHYGQLANGGHVVASEVAALSIVDAIPIREIEPGELLTIDKTGVHSSRFAEAETNVCAFEYVYFSRPDNVLEGENVLQVRHRMGELLAEDDSVDVDFVVGVPNSGMLAANGYAWARGLQNMEAITRNNSVPRSFTASEQSARELTVKMKLNPIPEVLKDKSIVLIDDSIVRGTTMREVVGMLRGAGAKAIHLRISSPPYRWPCFYGMDTSREHELISAYMTNEELCAYIGADSLKFLTNEQMQSAVGSAAGKICTACTTGVYPTEVPVELRPRTEKDMLLVV